jgi:hypothetical protein
LVRLKRHHLDRDSANCGGLGLGQDQAAGDLDEKRMFGGHEVRLHA